MKIKTKPAKRKPATTDTAIKNANPENKEYKLTVGQGLHLLVRPSGTKTFRLKYRIYGKEKLLTIGAYPEVSLAQANKATLEARELLAMGIDPQIQKKEQQKKEEEKNNKLMFKQVAERWFLNNSEKAREPWAPATAKKIRKYLKKDILPELGNQPIEEITRKQLNALIRKIEKRGAYDIGRSVRGWLKAIFDEALDNEEIENTPAYRLKPSIYAKGYKSTPHPNVGYQGLKKLIVDIDNSAINEIIKIAIKLLILNAPRPSELRLSEWSEFDLDNGLWHLPAERTKTRKPHTVPLAKQSIELLLRVKEINPEGYLFVVQGNKPFSENTLGVVLKRLGYQGKQTGHGFRHLFSTEMNERGYNRDHIEEQLAHKDKDQTRQTYNGAKYLEQRAKMIQDWANSIDALRAGADVVAFKSATA